MPQERKLARQTNIWNDKKEVHLQNRKQNTTISPTTLHYIFKTLCFEKQFSFLCFHRIESVFFPPNRNTKKIVLAFSFSPHRPIINFIHSFKCTTNAYHRLSLANAWRQWNLHYFYMHNFFHPHEIPATDNILRHHSAISSGSSIITFGWTDKTQHHSVHHGLQYDLCDWLFYWEEFVYRKG